jgi:2-desacetyl-2-hydroxyethyl bacteriochlorophyllide A dehydrogenase
VRARAVRFLAPRQVSVDDVEPAEPGPGDLVVRTEYSGISGGSEMLAYRGEIDPSLALDETLGSLGGTFEFPFSYGYSCVGVVERSGGSIPEGERVFAFHPHQDRIVVDESDAIALGAADPRLATLFPLVETALQVSLDAEAAPGDRVAVLGLGAVGTLSALLIERSGATVIGADLDPRRREAAASAGVTAVAAEDLSGEVRRATDGRGADLVVDATGNPEALADGLKLLAHEGTALVCSWYGTKPVPLPLGAEFHRRRLTIRSTQVSTIPARLASRWTRERRRAETRELLEELQLKPLATHEFSFEEAAAAYAAIDGGLPGLVHVALRYG